MMAACLAWGFISEVACFDEQEVPLAACLRVDTVILIQGAWMTAVGVVVDIFGERGKLLHCHNDIILPSLHADVKDFEDGAAGLHG